MKKIIISIAIILLGLYAIFPVISHAVTNEFVSIRYDNTNQTKDEIKVIFNVGGVPDGIMALQGTLIFDHDALELVDAKINNENWMISAFNKENGRFLAEVTDEAFFDTERHLFGKEDLIEFTFKQLKKSNCKIELEDVKLVKNTNGDTVDVDKLVIKNGSNLLLLIIVIIVIGLLVIMIKTKKQRRKNEK